MFKFGLTAPASVAQLVGVLPPTVNTERLQVWFRPGHIARLLFWSPVWTWKIPTPRPYGGNQLMFLLHWCFSLSLPLFLEAIKKCFFKSYFIRYAITLLPIFHHWPPCTQQPHSSGHPDNIVHVHGSCVQVVWLLHFLLYFTSPWLFCNYLLVLLNPLTSLPIPSHPPPFWQPSKCLPCPWFCLCSSSLLSLIFRFNCW